MWLLQGTLTIIFQNHLNVSQTFDMDWHVGLLQKLSTVLPSIYLQSYPAFIYNPNLHLSAVLPGIYYWILPSYQTYRQFPVVNGITQSMPYRVRAVVPNGSVLGLMLYLLYKADGPQPTLANMVLATFVDDTALLTASTSYPIASSELQVVTNSVITWTNKWKLEINETKSAYIDFALRKYNNNPITVNGVVVPYTVAKYLRIQPDQCLSHQTHI